MRLCASLCVYYPVVVGRVLRRGLLLPIVTPINDDSSWLSAEGQNVSSLSSSSNWSSDFDPTKLLNPNMLLNQFLQNQGLTNAEDRTPIVPPPAFSELNHWNAGERDGDVVIKNRPIYIEPGDIAPSKNPAELLSAGLIVKEKAAAARNSTGDMSPGDMSSGDMSSGDMSLIGALNQLFLRGDGRRRLQILSVPEVLSPNKTAAAISTLGGASASLSDLFSAVGRLESMSGKKSEKTDALSGVFQLLHDISGMSVSMLVSTTTTTPSPAQRVQSGISAIMAGISQLGQVLQSLNAQLGGQTLN